MANGAGIASTKAKSKESIGAIHRVSVLVRIHPLVLTICRIAPAANLFWLNREGVIFFGIPVRCSPLFRLMRCSFVQRTFQKCPKISGLLVPGAHFHLTPRDSP
jgi:hypothetical protein